MTDDSAERWMAVPGYSGLYEVSDFGRVRSVDRTITRSDGHAQRNKGRLLKPGADAKGRLQVVLRLPGDGWTVRVHTLVLLAFVGPRPEGLEACHGDGDASNNALSNLRYDTRSANRYDSVRHGTHPMTARTRCPRMHLLSAPNLVACVAAQDHRSCLACSRARSDRDVAAKNGKEFDFQAIADRHYVEITLDIDRGRMSKRTHCPREHALTEPNLVASALKDGRRSCLACARAYGAPSSDTQSAIYRAAADRKYEEIMSGR